MKKLSFLGAVLLAASLIFTGCSNGNDSDSGSGSSKGPALPELDVSDFANCKTNANTIEFGDGTEWYLDYMVKGEVSSNSRAADGTPFVQTFSITINATNSTDYDFTGGTAKLTLRAKDVLDPDDYEDFKNMSDADKLAFENSIRNGLKTEFADDYVGEVFDAGIVMDDFIEVIYRLGTTYLAGTKEYFANSLNASGTKIMTNDDKSKYVMTAPVPGTNGKTQKLYFEKIKKGVKK